MVIILCRNGRVWLGGLFLLVVLVMNSVCWLLVSNVVFILCSLCICIGMLVLCRVLVLCLVSLWVKLVWLD